MIGVRHGLRKNCILGDHGWFDKRFMYEESLRMPLVLSYPRDVPAGHVHEGIVTNVDFAQTVLDAARVEGHPRVQGRSFWPEMTGQPNPVPPSAGMYYRYWEHGTSSTTHRLTTVIGPIATS